MLLLVQVVTVFLALVAMSLTLAHTLELLGKMWLSKENYIATQSIYYPGFTIGGIAEATGVIAALVLLPLTPSYSAAFWWTLAEFLCLAGMQAAYWILTRPVSKFWVKDLALNRLGGDFFALGSGNRSAQAGQSAADEWVSFRNRWEYSHVFRAVLSAVALISLIVAVAARGNS